MAVTWDVEIEVLSLAAKRLRVNAARTDDAVDALVPEWALVVYGQVDTDNLAASRQKFINRLWGAWQEYLSHRSQVDALLTGWETALESDLDALEAS